MHELPNHRWGRPPRVVALWLILGWAVIGAKCAAVPWVFAYWQIPVAAGWVILPTLFFAAFVTALVLFHDWSDEVS